jgi:hypothetical protein
MLSISPEDLQNLINQANLPIDHPINLLIQSSPLEDAALGGIEGIKVLQRGPYKGKVSRRALEQARKNAERMGRFGEELIFSYFEQECYDGVISQYIWEADENAISPYDFEILTKTGKHIFVDVKTTKGSFANPMHISYNELLKMKESEEYQIYRIFDITEEKAMLRISVNMKDFAKQIIDILQKLPTCVHPDGISISPSELSFTVDAEIKIQEKITI